MPEIARAADDGAEATARDRAASDAPAPWSLQRRIGFRFVFTFSALWLFPFPLGVVPGTRWAAMLVDNAWYQLVPWLGETLLSVDKPIDIAPNGSSDRTFDFVLLLLLAILATSATIVWSIVDRRRPHYDRLYQWLRVYLRFAVATIMIGYGYDKIFHSQFPSLTPAHLQERYGDASPMGLLWTFMGYSGPYNVFTGLAEAGGAVLLVFRRTATLGALVLVAVMANVVMLNFCYDVPVKLFSTELLLASLFLAAPRLGAIFDVLVRGRAVAARPLRPLFARRRFDRAARGLGLAFAAYVLIAGAIEHRRTMRARDAASPVLDGIAGSWDVDDFVRDGESIAATSEDATRWKSVILNSYERAGRLVYQQGDDGYGRFDFQHDAATKTLTLGIGDENRQALTYAQPDADHLRLRGDVGGHALELALHRHSAMSELRLMTRRFHWINESPYNY